MNHKLFFSIFVLFSIMSLVQSCSSYDDTMNDLTETYIAKTDTSKDAFIDSLKKREPVVRVVYSREVSKIGIPYEIRYPLKISYINEADSITFNAMTR